MVQTTLRDRIQSIEDAISAGQIDDAMAHCQQILARYPDALEIQRTGRDARARGIPRRPRQYSAVTRTHE